MQNNTIQLKIVSNKQKHQIRVECPNSNTMMREIPSGSFQDPFLISENAESPYNTKMTKTGSQAIIVNEEKGNSEFISKFEISLNSKNYQFRV